MLYKYGYKSLGIRKTRLVPRRGRPRIRLKDACGKVKASVLLFVLLAATLAGGLAAKAHAMSRSPQTMGAATPHILARAGSDDSATILCGNPHRNYGLQYHHAFRRFAVTNGSFWRHIVKDSPLPAILRLPDFSAARPPLFHPPD